MRALTIAFVLLSIFLGPALHAEPLQLKQGWFKFHHHMSEAEMIAGERPADFRPVEYPWFAQDDHPFPVEDMQHFGSYWYELPELEAGAWQLRINQLSSAYEAWLFPKGQWDKRIHFGAGRPGLSPESEARSYRWQTPGFDVRDKGEAWILVINFSYTERNSGGLWSAPQLAPGRQLELTRNLHFYLLCFCLGSLFILGLYMLMIYIRRREDRSALYLCLLCSGLILRAMGVEKLLCDILDPLDSSLAFDLSNRFEYASISWTALFIIPFIRSTFTRARPIPYLDRVLLVSHGICALLMACLDFRGTLKVLGYAQMLTLVSVIYLAWILAQALKAKEEGAGYMLVSTVVPILVVVFEIFHSRSGGNLRLSHFAGTFFIFMQSQILAKRFATAFRQAEYLSASLQLEVKRQTSQIRHILDHLPEGLFRLDGTQRITPPYSRYMTTLFDEATLTQENLTELWARRFQGTAEDHAMMQSIFAASFGEDAVNWEMNSDHLPHEARGVDGHSFEFKWYPIFEKEVLSEVIGIIRDITALKKLEEASQAKEAEFLMLRELFEAPPRGLAAFLQQSAELLQASHKALSQQGQGKGQRSLRFVFSLLHTFKGNARQMHLSSLASLCHAIEERYARAVNDEQPLQIPEALADIEQLMQKLQKFQAVYEKFFGRLRQDKVDFSVNPEDLKVLQQWLDSDPKVDSTVLNILRGRLGLSMAHAIQDMDEAMADVAQALHKAPPIIDVEWSERLELTADLKRAISSALGHIFRNSMDHGIELPDQRVAAGKKARGRLIVRTEEQGQRWRVLIWDDGQGLNPGRIKENAVRKGLIMETSILTFPRAAELLFSPGFSTASKVSDISGRGIGMDAIRNLLEPFGVWIELEPLDSQILDEVPLGEACVPFRIVLTIPQRVLEQVA